MTDASNQTIVKESSQKHLGPLFVSGLSSSKWFHHPSHDSVFFLFPLGPIRKYPADLKVKFPDTTALVGQNLTLECFALGK